MSNKKWDSDWVHFSKRARRGVIVLLLLFIAIAVSPRLYYNYIHEPEEYEIKVLKLEKDAVDTLITENTKENRYAAPDAVFNPNEYTVEEWMEIGLSEKQAVSILNYLGSGAEIRIKSDLKKLYVVDEELYQLLKPKLNLPDSLVDTKREKPKYKEYRNEKNDKQKEDDFVVNEREPIEPISINTATVLELKSISGIGPYFSKEIVKLREAYGGIIDYNQLYEIYKFDEEHLEQIKPYLIIDENEVKQIDINSASEKELRKHPLIDYDMAKSIVYFRENHRLYKSIDEVILSPYIDRETFLTLKPYLKIGVKHDN